MKLREVRYRGGYGYFLICPGCGEDHYVQTSHEGGGETWSFNRDQESPTFSPSLLVTYEWGESREPRRCHSFIENGHWRYLQDCTHHLAGQTVPIPDYDEEHVPK